MNEVVPLITFREHVGSLPVFGGVRVAHLFGFLCCVFGGIRVAHLFGFLCYVICFVCFTFCVFC